MDDTDFSAQFDRVLFTEKQIAARVKELAAQVDADYAGED
ncbi:MAG TPA: hypoxanthine phosphoribosyltransferase, partial [Actinobacteria bacterium]|nr:hypoxanthine phosphoribosyltransferase [Actinomycetota bacterium]